MTPPESFDRNPLRTVASAVAKATGLAAAAVTSIVGFGILTAVQGNALIGLLGIIPGLITAIGTAWAAFRTAARGEQHVTPLADPRDNDGTPLIPDYR
jgi:hypothetical protein